MDDNTAIFPKVEICMDGIYEHLLTLSEQK